MANELQLSIKKRRVCNQTRRGASEIPCDYFLVPPPDGAEGADGATLVVDRLLLLIELPDPPPPDDAHDEPDDEPE